MQAAMPLWRGLKWVRMAGDWSTVSRKHRISRPVQMLEKLAWAGCSWRREERERWREIECECRVIHQSFWSAVNFTPSSRERGEKRDIKMIRSRPFGLMCNNEQGDSVDKALV
jgi:hypothetical protein